MMQKNRALTLIELAAVVGAIVTLFSVSFTALERARELSRRTVCSANLKGIGAAAKIYANMNSEKWMIPAFKRSLMDNGGIDYLCHDGTTGPPNTDPGEVGFEREAQSTSETADYPNDGSPTVSVTRAFWILVRSDHVVVEQFNCPSSSDTVSDGENPILYYDFAGYPRISYGYLVPFGPRATQPREGMDDGQVLAADKGPYYVNTGPPPFDTGGQDGEPITINDHPRNWRPFNSPNHGGPGVGEGQNCLYGDGAVRFQRTPVVGIDNDNIYTLMVDEWHDDRGRVHGVTPHLAGTGGPPYPGQNAFGVGPGNYAATDSLIYP